MKKLFLLLLLVAVGISYYSLYLPHDDCCVDTDGVDAAGTDPSATDAESTANPKNDSARESTDNSLFYQTLDNAPAQVLSPEQALLAFKIAPGFEIELVAAEPLVEDPVAMAWDEYGRLYVVEMRGYMPNAYGTGSEEAVGQVVRLEDADGDGRMDTSEVFLGGLVNPRAVVVVNEGVLIGEPPDLWLCELPARDALCQNRRRVGGYATDVDAANVEHMENGLFPGLDNWLYNAKSSRSLRIQGGELVEREGLFRGQWGITRDDYGRLLYNHNSTWIQADLFAGEDLVRADLPPYRQGLGVNLTRPAEVFSVRVNPGVNRAYLDATLRDDGRLFHTTGVSGLAAYRGDQFPSRYHSDIFVPEVAANVVAQFEITEQGTALEARQRLYDDEQWGKRDFLGSTDERFRPVDALNGPDGALYIIDMYRGIVQDNHFLTDELREQILQRGLDKPVGMGRIWRVRHTEGRLERSVPDIAGASSAELIAALNHSNGWVRDTAQRLLLGREGNLEPALSKVADGDDTIGALHAIWTLQGRGELRRELVLQLVNSGDTQRQIHALRAGHSLLAADDFPAMYAQWKNAPEALIVQQVLVAGDYTGDTVLRGELASILMANLQSAFVRQAVLRAVAGHELEFLREILRDKKFDIASAPTRNLLRSLGSGAYRNLRGDLTSGEIANPALQELLSVAASRSGALSWQQISLLKGIERVSKAAGFVPARMKVIPPIFSDASIAEKKTLWNARSSAAAAFTWPGDELAFGPEPLRPGQLELMASGQLFYPRCGACHGGAGEGLEDLGPPLAESGWVIGPPEWLARIILQGLVGEVMVKGKAFNGVMPAHGHLTELDDATLAGLMIYMRRSWGNKADAVSVAGVAAIRAASSDRKAPWTVAELESVPFGR